MTVPQLAKRKRYTDTQKHGTRNTKGIRDWWFDKNNQRAVSRIISLPERTGWSRMLRGVAVAVMHSGNSFAVLPARG